MTQTPSNSKPKKTTVKPTDPRLLASAEELLDAADALLSAYWDFGNHPEWKKLEEIIHKIKGEG